MLCQAIIILLLILLQGAADSVETAAYPEDFDALLETAHAGDVRAQVAAGIVYFYGREGGVDYGEAIRWFGTAASDEDPIALYFLGAIHGAGYGAETDTARAREYYERSAPGLRRRAAEGDPDAMANLGLLFNLGVAIPAHPDSARHWVERRRKPGCRAPSTTRVSMPGMVWVENGTPQEHSAGSDTPPPVDTYAPRRTWETSTSSGKVTVTAFSSPALTPTSCSSKPGMKLPDPSTSG